MESNHKVIFNVKSYTMNNKERRGILRVFRAPRDWRKRGNMEFDELLAICLSHPKVGQEEVMDRIKLWGHEYHIAQYVLRTLAVIITLPVITFFFLSNPVAEILMLIIICCIVVSMYRVVKRKTAIRDKLENLYGWLLIEIPYSVTRMPEFMEHAFIRMSERLVNEEWKGTRKMIKTIAKYGDYSLITLNN